MELWTHVARVTSVAVSPAGQILASGDEQGNLKLLMLRLLDDIIPTQTAAKNAIDKRRNQARSLNAPGGGGTGQPPSFSPFLPEYRAALRAHDGGPVFSLQWLPMPVQSAPDSEDELLAEEEGLGPRKTRYYALATGSVDRAVRIWGVKCCTQTGLKVTPIMVLDTLTTHVLCMHSFLRKGRPKREDSIISKDGKLRKRTGAGSSVFVAAGTNIGSIYVWSMETTELFGAIHGEFPTSHAIDDGSRLHSLLQTSDRPIVSVGLSLGMDPELKHSSPSVLRPEKARPNVVLVAGDARGCVRTHRESDELEVREYAASHHSGSRRPITLCGEVTFEDMVVACSFQEVSPNTITDQKGTGLGSDDVDSGYEKKSGFTAKWRGSRMLLGTSDGQLQVLKTDRAFYPPIAESKLQAAYSSEEEESVDEPEEEEEEESEEEVGREERPLVDGLKPVAKRAPGGKPPKGGKKASFAGPAHSSKSSLFVDTTIVEEGVYGGSPPSAAAAEGAVRFESPEAATLRLVDPSTTPDNVGAIADNYDDEQEEEEPSWLPRPPLAQTGAEKPSYNTSQAGRTPKPVKSSAFSTSDAGHTPRVKGMSATITPESAPSFPPEPPAAAKGYNIIDAGKTPRPNRGGGQKIFMPPPRFAEDELDKHANNKAKKINGGDERRVSISQEVKVGTQLPEPSVTFADEGSAAPVRTATTSRSVNIEAATTVPPHSLQLHNSTEFESEPEPESSAPQPTPSPTKEPVKSMSEFNEPAICSTSGLSERVHELERQLEYDDISVSTVMTTESDRRAAARLVDVPPHAPKYSHQHLTEIKGGAIPRTKGKVAKGVDPLWLLKKKNLGPEKADVSSMWSPDPDVLIRLNPPKRSPRARSLTKSERKNKVVLGTQNDLFATSDPKTLLPIYSLDINIDQVFDDLDASKAWRDGDEDFVDHWEANALANLVPSIL